MDGARNLPCSKGKVRESEDQISSCAAGLDVLLVASTPSPPFHYGQPEKPSLRHALLLLATPPPSLPYSYFSSFSSSHSIRPHIFRLTQQLQGSLKSINMPMHWNAENDRKLFLTLIKSHNVSVNAAKIAEHWRKSPISCCRTSH